jgi:hypothetical protein
MEKLQSAAVAVAVAALAAAGVDAARATANASTAAPAHRTQAASSWGGGSVRANERVVEAFIQDVLDGHQEASGFFTPDATWSGGTAGTVTGGKNVAGLFDGSAAALPDEHVTLEDIFRLSQGKVASITGRRLLDRDPLRDGRNQGALDLLTPIRYRKSRVSYPASAAPGAVCSNNREEG